MQTIGYQNEELIIEDIPVRQLGQNIRPPFYVYSKNSIESTIKKWQQTFKSIDPLICFALKANDNLNIIQLCQQLGLGADVVSAGELFLARKAGVEPEKIVFAGVGKQEFEIEFALQQGIRAFNVESDQELKTIQQIAKKMDRTASIHIRVNPDIDAGSHPNISTGKAQNKFGIEIPRAIELIKYARTQSHLSFKGLHVHIGSQILDTAPFERCSREIRKLYLDLKNMGIQVEVLNLGGGLGVDYYSIPDFPPNPDDKQKGRISIEDYSQAVLKHIGDLPVQFIFEPGRSIISNSGVLIVGVIYTKTTSGKKFIIVNGGMNDLLRPGLYHAYHRILPVSNPIRERVETVDIVGPICETTDAFALDRILPQVEPGELLVMFSAGAYGYSLSSNYNARPRLAEIMVDHSDYQIIRRAETYEDLLNLYDQDFVWD